MAENAGSTHPTYGAASGLCAVCGETGSKACARCRVDFYCGKEHQAKHWPEHRMGCGVFKVCSNAELGRHLVATKDIPAGVAILREIPLVALPKVIPRPDPVNVCVGCYKLLPLGRERRCSKCGFPVCGQSCSKREDHVPECSALQRANFKRTKGGVVGRHEDLGMSCLRIWAASRTEPVGSYLKGLQSERPSHDMLADDADFYERNVLLNVHLAYELSATRAVDWLSKEVGVDWLDEDEMRRWINVRLLNCLSSCPGKGESAGLFAGIALMEHSCAPNAVLSPIQNEHCGHFVVGSRASHPLEHVVLTVRRVARGEHLALSYAPDALKELGRRRRQRRVAVAWWGFLCRCSACRDDEGQGEPEDPRIERLRDAGLECVRKHFRQMGFSGEVRRATR